MQSGSRLFFAYATSIPTKISGFILLTLCWLWRDSQIMPDKANALDNKKAFRKLGLIRKRAEKEWL
jgi:hypothetical protein